MGCIHDHKNYCGGHNEETDKDNCKEGYYLHGTGCQFCSSDFGWIEGGKCVIPSIEKPIYVCVCRGNYGCTFSHCYTSKSTTSNKKRKGAVINYNHTYN